MNKTEKNILGYIDDYGAIIRTTVSVERLKKKGLMQNGLIQVVTRGNNCILMQTGLQVAEYIERLGHALITLPGVSDDKVKKMLKNEIKQLSKGVKL